MFMKILGLGSTVCLVAGLIGAAFAIPAEIKAKRELDECLVHQTEELAAIKAEIEAQKKANKEDEQC